MIQCMIHLPSRTVCLFFYSTQMKWIEFIHIRMADIDNNNDDALTPEIVLSRIDYGSYVIVARAEGTKKGRHYTVLQDIKKDDGKILKGFYYCPECKDVIKRKASGGTTPLIRHANACDPSKKSTSKLKNTLRNESFTFIYFVYLFHRIWARISKTWY